MARFYDEDSYDEEEYNDYEDEDSIDNGYEWTLEDSWDALTDGMYGPMPHDPTTYDLMMDIMGF